ncbi:TPA: helix-turn-helix domain-containing protein [Serratia marcescens]
MNIVFIDGDEFFKFGLKKLLLERLEWGGAVLDCDQTNRADVVFKSIAVGQKSCFCFKGGKINISIHPTVDTQFNEVSHCANESGVIYRNESIDKLVMRIKNALKNKIGGMECEPCYHSLTHCEVQVINYIMNGVPPTKIAYYFHRSVNTISRHKRSAMRKLGLNSDFELYSWLRNS